MPTYIVGLGIVLSLASIGLGFQLGQSTLAHLNSKAQQQKSESDAAVLKELVEEEERREREREAAEDLPDGDLAAVSAGFLEPCKMVRLLMDLMNPEVVLNNHVGPSSSDRFAVETWGCCCSVSLFCRRTKETVLF